MKKVLLTVSILTLCLTAGCRKKSTDFKTENPSTENITTEAPFEDTSAYSLINAVNGFTFMVRNADLSDNYTFNPSTLNTHQSPFFYYLGSWGDGSGNIQYYEEVEPPADMPMLYATGNVYVYYGDSFSYDVNTNGELSVSISIIKDSDNFVKFLNSIGVTNASDITYANDDSFTYERQDNTFICRANINYKSRLGKDFTGVAVVYETDYGQSYLIAGGEDFSDTDKKVLGDKFVMCDNVSNVLSYYPEEYNPVVYDLGGKSISATFPSFFNVDTSIGGWYWSDRCGFPDLFNANEYLRTAVLGTVYYMPVDNLDTDSFLYAYSPYLYNPYSADAKSELRDADGHTWTRYSFSTTSEVSSLNHTVLYVYIEGNYVYFFGLYFDNNLNIDYAPYMDNAISSIHIADGFSEPYTRSSDFFYLNLGLEIPPEEPASPTDAVPEGTDGIIQEQQSSGNVSTGENQEVIIDSQDPTDNMSEGELQQFIRENEGKSQ